MKVLSPTRIALLFTACTAAILFSVPSAAMASQRHIADSVTPDAPASVTVTVNGQDNITVNWDDPAADIEPDLIYNVRVYSTDNEMLTNEIVEPGASNLTISDGNFNGALGSSFYATVSATDSSGSSPEVSSNNFLIALPPNAPTGVAVSASASAPNNIVVSWNDAGENGSPLLGYTVDVYDAKAPNSSIDSTSIAVGVNSVSIPYSSFNAIPGDSYYVRVSATNGIGTGDYSLPDDSSLFVVTNPQVTTKVSTKAGTSSSENTVSPNSPMKVNPVPVVGLPDLAASLSKQFGVPASEFTIPHLVAAIVLIIFVSMLLGWIFRRRPSR